MNRVNIALFLNYSKSRNIFIKISRYFKYLFIKYKIIKNSHIDNFKNKYSLVFVSDKNIYKKIYLNKYDIAIIVSDEKAIKNNIYFILQLKNIINNIILLTDFNKTNVNLDMLSDILGISIVGTNRNNLFNLNKIIKNITKNITKNIYKNNFEIKYPYIAQEQINLIKNLFPKIVDKNKKIILTLKLLDNDFTLIDKILEMYKIDKYEYLNIKQELIEYGYDKERLKETYFKFYKEETDNIYNKIIKDTN